MDISSDQWRAVIKHEGEINPRDDQWHHPDAWKQQQADWPEEELYSLKEEDE
jgi:hypothetical protein